MTFSRDRTKRYLRAVGLVKIEYSTGDASKMRTFSDMLLPYAIFLGDAVVFAVVRLISLALMTLGEKSLKRAKK